MRAVRLSVLVLLILSATNVLAVEDDSFANYESLINELKADADLDDKPQPIDLNWEEVALHGGLAGTLSYLRVDALNGMIGNGLLKGFEGHFGMNLFTRMARAEFLFRNFASEAISRNMQVGYNEFESRVVFLPIIKDRTLLRMGVGLGLRQIEVDFLGASPVSSVSQSHMASSLLLGLERKVAQEVSLGPDFSYRTPLSDGAIEKSSWDASFRLNATF